MSEKYAAAPQPPPLLCQDGEACYLDLQRPRKWAGLSKSVSAYVTEVERRPADTVDMLSDLLRTIMTAAEATLLAETLLARFGSLSAVLAATEELLCGVPGMTGTAAHLIRRVHELCGAAAREKILQRKKLKHLPTLKRYLQARLRCRPFECLLALYLDCKYVLLREEILWHGSLQECPLYPRIIALKALHHNAAGLILAHNHPSGSEVPSQRDLDVTRHLAAVLAGIDVALHDHVIVGDNQILSMRSHGFF